MGNSIKRILFLTRPYHNYSSADYQRDYISALQGLCNLDIFIIPSVFGELNDGDSRELGYSLLKKARKSDLILIGHHFFGESLTGDIAPGVLSYLADCDVPKAAFVNKDYNRLHEKMLSLCNAGVTKFLVHTRVLQSIAERFSISTNQILFCPFGINEKVWGELQPIYHRNEDYSFSFSGVTHNHLHFCQHQLVRQEIESRLYFKIGKIRLFKKYAGKKFYWNAFSTSDGGLTRFFNRYRRLEFKEYSQVLRSSAYVLCTPSMNHITPRYFEALVCGATPLTPYHEDLQLLADLMEHICVFRNPDEFFDIVSRDDLEPPKRVRLREWALDTSTYRHRVEDILEFLFYQPATSP